MSVIGLSAGWASRGIDVSCVVEPAAGGSREPADPKGPTHDTRLPTVIARDSANAILGCLEYLTGGMTDATQAKGPCALQEHLPWGLRKA